jgi:hypothetical protein
MLGNKTLTLGHALFGLNKLPQENFPFHWLRLRTACAGSSGCAPLHVIQVSLITRTTFDLERLLRIGGAIEEIT